MEKERGIIIVGASGIGKSHLLANSKAVVMDSQFTDLREPEPFLITRLTEFEEPWIDPKEPIINYKKHEETCAKNRTKRKKRKRR